MGPSGIHKSILPYLLHSLIFAPPRLFKELCTSSWQYANHTKSENTPYLALPTHTCKHKHKCTQAKGRHTHSRGMKQYDILIRAGCTVFFPSQIFFASGFSIIVMSYASYLDSASNVCLCVWEGERGREIVSLHLKGTDVITSGWADGCEHTPDQTSKAPTHYQHRTALLF